MSTSLSMSFSSPHTLPISHFSSAKWKPFKHLMNVRPEPNLLSSHPEFHPVGAGCDDLVVHTNLHLESWQDCTEGQHGVNVILTHVFFMIAHKTLGLQTLYCEEKTDANEEHLMKSHKR